MTTPRVLVLGAGRIGSEIAADLARGGDLEVAVADRDRAALESAAGRARARGGLEAAPIEADLSDPAAVGRLVSRFDVVAGAVSSHAGFAVMEAVVRAGKPYCDVSFMHEDAGDLDGAARSSGATVVYDCGVAPGMSNVLAARAFGTLDACRSITIYVGGVPERPRPPFFYKAAFDPRDVLEEYTRPARLVEDGAVVVREALSEPEVVCFDGVGTLEAFNTDGLRSLAALPVPFMREKTLRHPGHREIMTAMVAAGFFRKKPVSVGGVAVRPFDIAAELLTPEWTYAPGEADLTVMRIVVEGVLGGAPTAITWELVDRYDTNTATTSMARTTAYPCSSMVRMLADGSFRQPGVHATERLAGDSRIFDRLMGDLESRGVVFSRKMSPVPGEPGD